MGFMKEREVNGDGRDARTKGIYKIFEESVIILVIKAQED